MDKFYDRRERVRVESNKAREARELAGLTADKYTTDAERLYSAYQKAAGDISELRKIERDVLANENNSKRRDELTKRIRTMITDVARRMEDEGAGYKSIKKEIERVREW